MRRARGGWRAVHDGRMTARMAAGRPDCHGGRPFPTRMRARGGSGACRDRPRWPFPTRMRDFQKLLVISPTSACAGAASGVLLRVAARRPVEPHAVYQALYADGPEREAARRPGQHTLAGVLTSIFPEARTRCDNDHRRRLATGGPTHSAPKRPSPRDTRPRRLSACRTRPPIRARMSRRPGMMRRAA